MKELHKGDGICEFCSLVDFIVAGNIIVTGGNHTKDTYLPLCCVTGVLDDSYDIGRVGTLLVPDDIPRESLRIVIRLFPIVSIVNSTAPRIAIIMCRAFRSIGSIGFLYVCTSRDLSCCDRTSYGTFNGLEFVRRQ